MHVERPRYRILLALLVCGSGACTSPVEPTLHRARDVAIGFEVNESREDRAPPAGVAV